MVKADMIEKGDFDSIKAKTKEAVEIVRRVRA
jgi:hypothetical protein